MKGYRNYMDRQQVSPALHDRLLSLEQAAGPSKAPHSRRRWQPVLTMAACLCVVLGLGWGAWSGVFGGGRFALGSSNSSGAAEAPAAAEPTEAESEEVMEETADQGRFTSDAAGAAAYDDAAQDTAEQESAAEHKEDGASPDAQASELLPPEDALIPGWLPEGYTLSAVEVLAQEHCYRLTWTSSDGSALTLEYAYTDQAPEDSLWPVYEWTDADWDTVPQGNTQDGVWGFGLYSSDLGCYYQFTTTSEDHEALWQVAHSMVR